MAIIDSSVEKFTLTRTFDAPIDLMWNVWTEKEHLAQWFGPKGFPVISSTLDFKVGGSYLYGMDCMGKEMWGKWIFRDIVKPEKIEFVMHFSNPEGGVTRHPFQPDWPIEMLSAFLFRPEGDKTKVTIEWAPLNPTPSELKTFIDNVSGMNQGWGGTFEQLETYLAALKNERF